MKNYAANVGLKKLSVLALFCLLFPFPLQGQTSGSAEQGGVPSAQDVQSNSGPEDNSHDETAQFKHSASVKLISKVT
ncbi:MAG TPA: hypothetical protein VH024_15725, partial [Candidatus Angelobacter sp.]|nr:hypothetical protein [Candidatus Angelobacter sp.]